MTQCSFWLCNTAAGGVCHFGATGKRFNKKKEYFNIGLLIIEKKVVL